MREDVRTAKACVLPDLLTCTCQHSGWGLHSLDTNLCNAVLVVHCIVTCVHCHLSFVTVTQSAHCHLSQWQPAHCHLSPVTVTQSAHFLYLHCSFCSILCCWRTPSRTPVWAASLHCGHPGDHPLCPHQLRVSGDKINWQFGRPLATCKCINVFMHFKEVAIASDCMYTWFMLIWSVYWLNVVWTG